MSRAQLAQLCARARRGLYAGRTVLSGNNVSDAGNKCVDCMFRELDLRFNFLQVLYFMKKR